MSQGKDDETLVEGAAVERSPAEAEDQDSGPLPDGTVLAGRYEVRKLIGRGGTGVVVEAYDRTLGVAVAIKVIRAEYTGQRRWTERLAREVALARKIQHPNVCRVFDFAQSDGRAFLIMELADGGTLRSQLSPDTARARPLSERLADARAIAAGVAAIHAAGIVHRDISPQNALRMSDGRLVVSDFGLATDAFAGSTSIHGGTVAYMAPEVLRGGRANFASDIWSLGAVIHEVVFGEQLRWDPVRGEMRSDVASASLAGAERGVLEICRACTALNPERRSPTAVEIAKRLDEAALARAGRRARGRRALAVAVATMVMIGGAVGVRRVRTMRRRATEAAAPAVDPLMMVPTGAPDDWTNKAKVLTEVPDRFRCMVALPDRHTIRFVWGSPLRAEDVDIHTGERRPAPLVPEAYAEGCPDLSADGKRLVYAGHTADDRAFAFVSAHPDGREGVPEIQTAAPSMDSDPVWLDSENFVYDVDTKYVGVFSMKTKQSVILPVPMDSAMTSFHEVIRDEVFVSAFSGQVPAEVRGFEFPSLEQSYHFRLSTGALDLSSDGRDGFFTAALEGPFMRLVRIEPTKHQARFVGAINGQALRHPILVDGGLVFASQARGQHLTVRTSGGRIVSTTPVADDLGWASKCGDKVIATQVLGTMARSVLLDAANGVEPVEGSELTTRPTCSSDGRTRFWSRYGKHTQLERCEGARCRTLATGPAVASVVSPDDKRLAFLLIDNRGPIVRWMSADGSGPSHDIGRSETGCAPIWSDEKDLWVSFREGRKIIWREVDTDSGRPTGRTVPGTRDCMSGHPDPGRPLHPPVEIEENLHSQLRFLPSKYLPAG